MGSRLSFVVGAGFVLSLSVVLQAFQEKRQFYPATVQLVNSGIGMTSIYFLLMLLSYALVKILLFLFFGSLRDPEVEHLWEKTCIAITETCLAMTIFRDDFTFKSVLLLGGLLSLKAFHWILEERINFMEQAPLLGWGFHVRTHVVTILLGALDSLMAYNSITTTIESGPTMHILFGFESVVLAVSLFAIYVKYVFHTIDLRQDAPWENKTIYILYLDVLCDFLKLVLYVCFFSVLVKHYGLPIYLVRDLVLTFRSFAKRVVDLVRSRRMMTNLNERFQDATPEELQRDNTCIVCREEMETAKKLPCGHMFHLPCLRRWLEQEHSCPTCRTDLLALPPRQAAPAPAAAAAAAPAAAAPAAAPAPAPAAAAAAGAPAHALHAAAQLAAQLEAMNARMAAAQARAQLRPNGQGQGAPAVPGQVGSNAFSGVAAQFVPFDFEQDFAEDFANMAALSDEELVAMEGSERQQVFSRVMFLRKLRMQIDLTIARFSQYESVAPRIPASEAATGAARATESLITQAAASAPGPAAAAPSPRLSGPHQAAASVDGAGSAGGAGEDRDRLGPLRSASDAGPEPSFSPSATAAASLARSVSADTPERRAIREARLRFLGSPGNNTSSPSAPASGELTPGDRTKSAAEEQTS